MDSFIEIVKDKTKNELLEMVYEFTEWSPEMLISVEKELEKRNILPNDIKDRKQQLSEIKDNNYYREKKQVFLARLLVG